MTAYTGPDYHTVKALDAHAWAVIVQPAGRRLGTYPSVEHAHRVAAEADALAMHEYLKAKRKAEKSAK